MYNEETKAWFLSENYDRQDAFRRDFANISDEENRLKKDIYNWTASEIKAYYKMRNLYSYASLLNIHSRMSIYTAWALKNNLVDDHQSHFDEIDNDAIRDCISDIKIEQAIVTREQILKMAKELPNASDSFLLLAFFEGIGAKGNDNVELRYAKTSDIKGNEMKLYTGRYVMVSNELIDFARRAAAETEYTGLTGVGKVRNLKPSEDGIIVKQATNSNDDTSEYYKGKAIYNRFVKIIDYVGMASHVTRRSLMDSGMICFIKEEAKTLGISTREYCFTSSLYARLEKQYGCKFSPSMFWKKYENFL